MKDAKILLDIIGDPVAQGRPRFVRRGKFIGTYDPEKSRTWKNSVRIQAIQQRTNRAIPLLDCALSMSLIFRLKRPKSLSKKVVHHTKKPDIDNLIKAVVDALKGVVYKDDSQIVLIMANKVYATFCTGVLIEIKGE